MRLLNHGLLVLMILGIGAAVLFFYVEDRNRHARIDLARMEVGRFQQQIHLQAALRPNDGPESDVPASVDPSWFQNNLPRNPLLGLEHPWLEVAAPEQRTLDHPPDLAALGVREYREVFFKPYRIIYRVQNEHVYVYLIADGRRDMQELLSRRLVPQ